MKSPLQKTSILGKWNLIWIPAVVFHVAFGSTAYALMDGIGLTDGLGAGDAAYLRRVQDGRDDYDRTAHGDHGGGGSDYGDGPEVPLRSEPDLEEDKEDPEDLYFPPLPDQGMTISKALQTDLRDKCQKTLAEFRVKGRKVINRYHSALEADRKAKEIEDKKDERARKRSEIASFILNVSIGFVAIFTIIRNIYDHTDPNVRAQTNVMAWIVTWVTTIVVLVLPIPVYLYKSKQDRVFEQQREIRATQYDLEGAERRLKLTQTRYENLIKRQLAPHQLENKKFFRIAERYNRTLPGGDELITGMERLVLQKTQVGTKRDGKPDYKNLPVRIGRSSYPPFNFQYQYRPILRQEDIELSEVVASYEIKAADGTVTERIPHYRSAEGKNSFERYRVSRDFYRRRLTSDEFEYRLKKLMGFWHKALRYVDKVDEAWIRPNPCLDALGAGGEVENKVIVDAFFSALAIVANTQGKACTKFIDLDGPDLSNLPQDFKDLFIPYEKPFRNKLDYEEVARALAAFLFQTQDHRVLAAVGVRNPEKLSEILKAQYGEEYVPTKLRIFRDEYYADLGIPPGPGGDGGVDGGGDGAGPAGAAPNPLPPGSVPISDWRQVGSAEAAAASAPETGAAAVSDRTTPSGEETAGHRQYAPAPQWQLVTDVSSRPGQPTYATPWAPTSPARAPVGRSLLAPRAARMQSPLRQPAILPGPAALPTPPPPFGLFTGAGGSPGSPSITSRWNVRGAAQDQEPKARAQRRAARAAAGLAKSPLPPPPVGGQIREQHGYMQFVPNPISPDTPHGI